MSILVAVAHIAGSIFAFVLLAAAGLLLGAWETQRNERRALENASLELGVPVEALDNPDIVPRLIQLSSSRYSSELLRNRLSDFCGLLRTAWGWLGSLAEGGILIAVTWYTFTSDPANAIYAWWIIGVAIFFALISIVFSLVCKLLTGRYPGEARQARKSLIKFIGEQRALNPATNRPYESGV